MYKIVNSKGETVYRNLNAPDENGILRFASGWGFVTPDVIKLRGYRVVRCEP